MGSLFIIIQKRKVYAIIRSEVFYRINKVISGLGLQAVSRDLMAVLLLIFQMKRA